MSHAPTWITRTKPEEWPTVEGWYMVMVEGDSESIDGHQIYAFDEYETWARLSIDADGNAAFKGIHDEEDFTIYAYYGPIIVPAYEAP